MVLDFFGHWFAGRSYRSIADVAVFFLAPVANTGIRVAEGNLRFLRPAIDVRHAWDLMCAFDMVPMQNDLHVASF